MQTHTLSYVVDIFIFRFRCQWVWKLSHRCSRRVLQWRWGFSRDVSWAWDSQVGRHVCAELGSCSKGGKIFSASLLSIKLKQYLEVTWHAWSWILEGMEFRQTCNLSTLCYFPWNSRVLETSVLMRGRIPRKYLYQQFRTVLLGYVIWCFLYIPFWAVVGIMTVKLFSIRLSKKSFVGFNMARSVGRFAA